MYWRMKNCHIPNSETCLKHVWLQYDIKSPWLFGFICTQNSVGGLVLYNKLNLIKFPQLFGFIWVKIHSHLYLFLLPNYLLQTPQDYLDFTWSFLLSNLNFYLVWNTHSEICFNYSFCYIMYLRLVITL